MFSDCCDGSDEYVSKNCSDFCSILGEEARIAAQKRSELIKTGCELREQLTWKGKKIREEKKVRNCFFLMWLLVEFISSHL